MRILAVFAVFAAIWSGAPAMAQPAHPWPHAKPVTRTLADIAPPEDFQRVPAPSGSFAAWLRTLPLKPEGTAVKLYDGRTKCFGSPRPGLFDCANYHVAIIDIDTGARDLQQCADAVMRLRAEYMLAAGRARNIAFNYTNGKRARFGGGSYKAFRKYMDLVFAYAGSYSLEKEMKPVAVADMKIGDVFIQGGFPGHAVIVIDMAEKPSTGEKRFLLAQSYMPAQDIHVLANPRAPGQGWYPLDFGDRLVTPEWTFKPGDLRRFRE